MLKNIIFDMGNVLLDYNPEIPLREFCSTEESRTIIRKELFQGKEWIMGDEGLIVNEERYPLVKERVPETYHDELKKCVDHWDICMIPIDGAMEFIRKIDELALKRYVLSNACQLFYRYFPRYYDMSAFAGIVVSSDVHMIKPDERIYKYLLEKYQLKPEECLFIDDVPANVEAAKQIGMKGYQFRNDYGRLYEYVISCI